MYIFTTHNPREESDQNEDIGNSSQKLSFNIKATPPSCTGMAICGDHVLRPITRSPKRTHPSKRGQ
jgi:hypothetical protein